MAKIDRRTKEYKEYIKNNPEALGNKIEKFTEKTGIKKVVKAVLGEDCGCDERRDFLNEKLPVRYKVKRCFTDEEKQWYKEYYETRNPLEVTQEQLDNIVKLHEGIFNWKVNNLCHNCQGSARIIRDMIERLDKVYKSYL